MRRLNHLCGSERKFGIVSEILSSFREREKERESIISEARERSIREKLFLEVTELLPSEEFSESFVFERKCS